MQPVIHSHASSLRARLRGIRGPADSSPDLSVVTPVNAKGDLGNVRRLLGDLSSYGGRHRIEIVLVVNNFEPDNPPPEVEHLRELGPVVLAIPKVSRRKGEAVCLAARIPGIRVASADRVVLFDADCRVPYPTALLDWYFEQFENGAHAAYAPVAYYDVDPSLSVRSAIAVHHASRWVKRTVFGIPTTRGSNYAVLRDSMLELYDGGFLADDLNVGPATKRLKGPVAYQGGKKLTVQTSGRMFRAGWRGKVPYFLYRLRYNVRVLPVRPDAARFTGRENDPADRYVYDTGNGSRKPDESMAG